MKAQSSLEFMVFIGLFMVVFVAFFAVLGDRMIDFQEDKDEKQIDDLMFMIESEFGLAHKANEGYIREIRLPELIQGINYTINLSAEKKPEIWIRYKGTEYTKPIFARVNGTLEPGKLHKIWKVQGNVSIRPI